MISVNFGAFLSISSWFCELTELIFGMIPYISSTGYPPKTQGIMGHVQVANRRKKKKNGRLCKSFSFTAKILTRQHQKKTVIFYVFYARLFWELEFRFLTKASASVRLFLAAALSS